MKSFFHKLIIILLILILILSFEKKIICQDNLISLNEFQQLSKEKKESYLKDNIAKFIYELKLIYYITLTDKPKELFIYWENTIKKLDEPDDEELKLKRNYTIITINIFLEKLSYLERNFSIINQTNQDDVEIQFIKAIYHIYYSFENSDNYINSRKILTDFLIENKMIAQYFMNYTSLDKIQIIITSNFDYFFNIFTDDFLMSKIKSIRSEELKKELISKIIIKKPSFISNQLKTLLMTSSNDFNSFLIRTIASNQNIFNKSERQNFKNQFLNLLKINSSEIIHKSIYYYFSKAEPEFYIENFRNFYKKEPNLMKIELIIYLLEIKNLSIYRTILLTYTNETDKWLQTKIYERLNIHTENQLPADMALEFLKQFAQVQEDRFILIKAKFLFYFKPNDKKTQEIRILALTSIDNNFIDEVDMIFSKYLSLEKDFEIFKKAIEITINHQKNNVLNTLTKIIVKDPINTAEYIKSYDYYNFLSNIFLFGIDELSYINILRYYFPLFEDIIQKKYSFDEKKLLELYNNIDGLYSKICFSYLPFGSQTKDLRLSLFKISYHFDLIYTANILLNREKDTNNLKEIFNTINLNPKKYIVKGIFNSIAINNNFSDQAIQILIKLIERDKNFDPFITNLDENLSKNYNIVNLIFDFFNKTLLFDYIYSINLVFKESKEDCYDILYNIFKLILQKNNDTKNKNEVFPYLLKYYKIRPIIYRLFIDNQIDKNKKLSIIDNFSSPELSDAADYIVKILSNKNKKDIEDSVKIINVIGKMNNPQKYVLIKEFVENSYEIKDIQLEFARSCLNSLSYDLIPHLVKLTDYKDAEVKEAALVALGYIPISDTLPILYNEYLKSRRPEKLYFYYSKADNELKKYWVDYLSKELKEEKFLDLVINGIYPYKIYQFDDIILSKIITYVEKPFYLGVVLKNISKIPSSQIVESLPISPFLFISDEKEISLKLLKLCIKLKKYEFAHYSILSKSEQTIDYFFSSSKLFENIDYTNLFDIAQNFGGKSQMEFLMQSIIKYSKSIGVKNTVNFFLRIYEMENSYKILVSLYPLTLDLEDCSQIVEKNISFLPFVLKLASKNDKIYQYFINLLFEKSSELSKEAIYSTINYCYGYIPDPFEYYFDKFLSSETRNEIKKQIIFYILSNIDSNTTISSTAESKILKSLSIDSEDYFWKIVENCKSLIILDKILNQNKNILKTNNSQIFGKILKSNSSIYTRNLLYLLFYTDQRTFFQYLNSSNTKIYDSDFIIMIVSKINKFDDLSYKKIIDSILLLKDESTVNNLIFDAFIKSFKDIDNKNTLYTINILMGRLNKINYEEFKDSKEYKTFILTLKSILISKISFFEKVNYINRIFQITKLTEKQFFNIIEGLRNEMDSDSLQQLYIILPFVENCKDLSYITEEYLSKVDIFKLDENTLRIILPKLDKKILSEYIINKNLDNYSLKTFVKIIPEIILLKPDIFSLFSQKEIANIYFKTKNRSFLFFFIENSLIKVDQIFSFADDFDKKFLLAMDILNYDKLYEISETNLKMIIQFIPKLDIKNNTRSDFTNKFNQLVNIYIYNFDKYDSFEKYELLNILLTIMPKDINSKKFENNIEFEKDKLTNFYSFLLLSSYFFNQDKLISFISYFSFPVYTSFEYLIKNKINELMQILYEINKKDFEEFDYNYFINDVLSIIIKLYPDVDILENYIIIPIKDDYNTSKIFWDIIIKYKVGGLIYIFDKYFGGPKWEKTRNAYLKLFK